MRVFPITAQYPTKGRSKISIFNFSHVRYWYPNTHTHTHTVSLSTVALSPIRVRSESASSGRWGVRATQVPRATSSARREKSGGSLLERATDSVTCPDTARRGGGRDLNTKCHRLCYLSPARPGHGTEGEGRGGGGRSEH